MADPGFDLGGGGDFFRTMRRLGRWMNSNPFKRYSYVRDSGTGVVPGQHNNLTAIFP